MAQERLDITPFKILTQPKEGYVFSPFVDFLTVGGLSYIFIALIWIFPASLYINFFLALYITYIINDPHFTSSYQVFYSGFFKKIRTGTLPTFMQIRYIFAGIVVPLIILSYFAVSYFTRNAEMLFFSANIMLFLVGWHYTKQSYGMLITLSALKKIYYDESAKKILLYNSYIVWITTWLYMNHSIAEINFMEITQLTFFSLPPSILTAALGICVLTTFSSVIALTTHYKKIKAIPVNALIGYSTVYIWLFLRWTDPVTYILIPAFHSLQYIPFILRYKINERKHALNKGLTRIPLNKNIALFVAGSLTLGALGFHIFPWVFDSYIPYDTEIFGTQMFLFIFIVFINIHHYFLDNVMWRKENKDITSHLFTKH